MIDGIYKKILEGLLFVLVIIILFNTLTDFSLKIGIIKTLNTQQIQYFGFLSSLLATLNILSKKFFGFRFMN